MKSQMIWQMICLATAVAMAISVKGMAATDLLYSTYFGGNITTSNDIGRSVAVGSDGSIYLLGQNQSADTASVDFPAPPSGQITFINNGSLGGDDVYVAKFDKSGALIYVTVVSGSNNDNGTDIAVDQNGSVYVVGATSSSDFPTTANAVASTCSGPSSGCRDAFLLKLSPDGSQLEYSSYLGGSDVDVGESVAIDSAGNAIITGYTISVDFPTEAAAFPNCTPIPSYRTEGPLPDGFVAKFGTDGSLVFSTYLGGDWIDRPLNVEVGGGDVIYVAGLTQSPLDSNAGGVPFPTQAESAGGSVYQDTKALGQNAFVSKFAPGGALIASTYLGHEMRGGGLAVDNQGFVYVSGHAYPGNALDTGGTSGTGGGGNFDIVVAKLKPDLSDLVYGTQIGGDSRDVAYGMGVDGDGNTYVAGWTQSLDFPITSDAIQTGIYTGTTCTFSPDGPPCRTLYLVKLDSMGSAVTFATYLGGSDDDNGAGVDNTTPLLAVDDDGTAYLVSTTVSSNFPITPDAFQTNLRGFSDAVLSVIGDRFIDVTIDIKPGSDPNSINIGSSGVIPVAIISSGDFDAPAQVNADTISLAGARVKMVGKSGKLLCHAEDVNGDYLDDLVCQVLTAQFMIEEGESLAVLEAETIDGKQIRGEDYVRIVPD